MLTVPDATPRSKSFKVGIPYIYALKFQLDISRGPRPGTEAADEENEAEADPFADDAEATTSARTVGAGGRVVRSRRY